MSRKNHHTIRSPQSFRKGASINAMKVDNVFDSLLSEKKEQIRQLIRDLHYSKAISEFAKCDGSRRALNFDVIIDYQIITVRFIIWTDNREPDFIDFSNSQRAQFVLRVNDNIGNVKQRFLNYIEGIKKGLTTEYLGMTALDELSQEPIGERKLKYFRKAKPNEDRYKGTDVVVVAIHDGREIEIPIQFKSSEERLTEHKAEFPNIPGLFRVFTGNSREELNIIKEKIIRIIDAFKIGEIIFI